MRIYHDEATGNILYTLTVQDGATRLPGGAFIEVPEQEIENIASWRVISGEFVLTDITPYRISAISRINAAIGEVRATLITDLPGQDMLYLRKESEARAWVIDPTPDLAAYPLIAAEVGITGADSNQIAQVWLNLSALWLAAAAALESARLGAIAAIGAAADIAQIDAVIATFSTSVAAMQGL